MESSSPSFSSRVRDINIKVINIDQVHRLLLPYWLRGTHWETKLFKFVFVILLFCVKMKRFSNFFEFNVFCE